MTTSKHVRSTSANKSVVRKAPKKTIKAAKRKVGTPKVSKKPMPPLRFDERFREYLVPPDDDAVIFFPIELGTGEITVRRHWDGVIAITPPPDCRDIEVKCRTFDGTLTEPGIFYTRKLPE